MARNIRTACAVAGAVFAATLTASAAFAQAGDPAAQPVQSFYDTLLDSMKHAKELGVKGRYDKLKPVIEQSFDLPDMARLSVGPSWTTMSPAEQKALTVSLERLTAANYASNFDGYDGEKFVVDPTTTARGTDKIVQTKLVTKKETIPFNYRMHQVGSSWKILDIYLNGYVSQLATQRSEFGATLASGGAAALEKKLDAQSAKLLKE